MSRRDSNSNLLDQNQTCCHYTTGQFYQYVKELIFNYSANIKIILDTEKLFCNFFQSFLRKVEDSNLWIPIEINSLAGSHNRPLCQLSNLHVLKDSNPHQQFWRLRCYHYTKDIKNGSQFLGTHVKLNMLKIYYILTATRVPSWQGLQSLTC